MQMLVLRTYLALRRDPAAGVSDSAAVTRPTFPSNGLQSERADDLPAPPTPPGVRLERAPDLDPDGYRALYSAVGQSYNWRDRLAWSDAELAGYLADPTVDIRVLEVDGAASGYFELRRHGVELPATARAYSEDADARADAHSGDHARGDTGAPSLATAPESVRPCELVYFGIVNSVQGRGLGRWLLERAIGEAWAGGADLLWLHTCSLDHPAAIPNYRARGFRPFATFLYEEEVAGPTEPATA